MNTNIDKMRIQVMKQLYFKGLKVKLIHMEGESQMSFGLIGEIEYVDDIGQIHVQWENGSSLALNADIDKFEII